MTFIVSEVATLTFIFPSSIPDGLTTLPRVKIICPDGFSTSIPAPGISGLCLINFGNPSYFSVQNCNALSVYGTAIYCTFTVLYCTAICSIQSTLTFSSPSTLLLPLFFFLLLLSPFVPLLFSSSPRWRVSTAADFRCPRPDRPCLPRTTTAMKTMTTTWKPPTSSRMTPSTEARGKGRWERKVESG